MNEPIDRRAFLGQKLSPTDVDLGFDETLPQALSVLGASHGEGDSGRSDAGVVPYPHSIRERGHLLVFDIDLGDFGRDANLYGTPPIRVMTQKRW